MRRNAKYMETHAALARELEREPPVLAAPPKVKTGLPRRGGAARNDGKQRVKRRALKRSARDFTLPSNYVPIEQVRDPDFMTSRKRQVVNDAPVTEQAKDVNAYWLEKN